LDVSLGRNLERFNNRGQQKNHRRMRMAVGYKELGFVNTREMFKRAMQGGHAVPAYNFNNLEQPQAIINGCGQSKSPVILQVSNGARNYANATLLRNMGKAAVETAPRPRRSRSPTPFTRED
jgi:hypothetical protein